MGCYAKRLSMVVKRLIELYRTTRDDALDYVRQRGVKQVVPVEPELFTSSSDC